MCVCVCGGDVSVVSEVCVLSGVCVCVCARALVAWICWARGAYLLTDAGKAC